MGPREAMPSESRVQPGGSGARTVARPSRSLRDSSGSALWHRPRRVAGAGAVADDPVLVSLGALALLIVLGYGFDVGGRVVQVVLCWLLLTALHALLAVLAWRVARLPRTPFTNRRVWGALAATGALYLAGDLVQLVEVARDPETPAAAFGNNLQFAFVVLGTALIVGAMLTSPLGLRSRREQIRFWLDAATVMVAAAVYGWYTMRFQLAADRSWVLDLIHTLALGPAIFLLGVFGVAKLILGSRPAFTRMAGVVCGLAAGLEALLQSLPHSWYYEAQALPWLLGSHVLASLLLAAAARIQQLQAQVVPFGVRPRPTRPYSVLPYAAIAATYALLVFVLATGGPNGGVWVVVGGAILSTALVIGRQLSAFRHISELLAERNALAAELTYQAFHDSLTGLANRALFLQHLEQALNRPGPIGTAADEAAVVLVDLDDFKPVNDRLGHAAGDHVLVQVSHWLRDCVRSGDMVARLGGDEFAVLAQGVPPGGWVTVAQRITEAVQRPARVGELDVWVHASVGVAVGRRGEHCAGELLHHADVAMYLAKDRGKGRYEIFDFTTLGQVASPAAAVLDPGA